MYSRTIKLIAILTISVVLLLGLHSAPLPTSRAAPLQATSQATQPDPAAGLRLPAGYRAEVIATGLNYPTHLAYGPDQALYVTQLYSGDENAGVGQVVRIATPGSAPHVLLENLLKPTGLAWAGNDLYIVAKNTVLVSHFKDGILSLPETVLKDLPFNGRSNGQIFLGPDGLLYFQSTGTEAAPTASGFIYTMQPGTSAFKVYARGLKNAYAMTWTPDAMYSTEIGDGAIPGIGQPPEKIVVVKQNADYGWPQCYGDRVPNPAWNGTVSGCAVVERPFDVLLPETTPTGLAYFDGQLIVALWNGPLPRLISVNPQDGRNKNFAAGFKAPIALLTAPDGSLLVVDMFGQSITRISKQ